MTLSIVAGMRRLRKRRSEISLTINGRLGKAVTLIREIRQMMETNRFLSGSRRRAAMTGVVLPRSHQIHLGLGPGAATMTTTRKAEEMKRRAFRPLRMISALANGGERGTRGRNATGNSKRGY